MTLHGLAFLVATLAGCEHRAPIASCSDSLDGEYDAGGARWVIRDTGSSLDAFPLFDDSKLAIAPPASEVAPRMIELRRTEMGLAGEVHRRFMQGATSCDALAAAHATSCSGDTLELVLADPVAPATFTPCRWTGTAPSHVERWRRR